jgi:hypothetical protein
MSSSGPDEGVGERNPYIENFIDAVFGEARPEVLDRFEDMGGVIADNLAEIHGYEEVGVEHRPTSIAETFAGPVMGGRPQDNSRNYVFRADDDLSQFELEVKDSSLSLIPAEQGIEAQPGNYRTLTFRYEDGDPELYEEFVEEFHQVLGPGEAGYGQDGDTYMFEFEREDVEEL